MYIYDKNKNVQLKSKSNNTGIPNYMKQHYENVAGYSLDDVKVHYNSSKPAQLQALAYTKGSDVYIGHGQEKHLRHELGHVIQQKQGIVKPTIILNGVAVNDDPALEKEADLGVQKISKPTQCKLLTRESNVVYDVCQRKVMTKEELYIEFDKSFSKFKGLFSKGREEIESIAKDYIVNIDKDIKGFRAGYSGEDSVGSVDQYRELGREKRTQAHSSEDEKPRFWGNAIYFISETAEEKEDFDERTFKEVKLSPLEQAKCYIKDDPTKSHVYSINFRIKDFQGFKLTELLLKLAEIYKEAQEITEDPEIILDSDKKFLGYAENYLGLSLERKSAIDVLYDKKFFLYGDDGRDCAFSDAVFGQDETVRPQYSMAYTKPTQM